MYSEDDEEIPEAVIGLFSPIWMARAMTLWTPRAYLVQGINGMLDYLQSVPVADTYEALDHFIQCTVNGSWQEPYPEPDQEESAPPITEDDIQKFLDQLGDIEE